MNKFSERRLKENEVIFQQANQGVADFILDDSRQPDPIINFYCECSNMNCREVIPLTASRYNQLHTSQRVFIALSGHDIPQIENVLTQEDGFVVIEKIGEVPSIKDIRRVLPDIADRQ